MSQKEPKAFSLAEALITLLIVAIITLATIPVITKKHRSKNVEKHGMYACYWNGNTLVARQMINGDKTPGTTQYDPQEGRQGCVFNPPPGAKNFVVTVVGGGGGGAGSGAGMGDKKIYTEPGDYTFTTPEPGIYQFLAVGGGGGGCFHSNTAFVTATASGSKNVQVKDGQQYRACSGTPGGLIYVPNQKLNKDVKFNIKVGAGGASSTSESRAAANGGETVILETLSGKMYANAGGGGGGCSYSTNQCYTINVSSGKIQPLTNRIYGKSAGYDSTGIFLSNDFGSNVSGTNKSNYENYIKSLYSAKTGEILSDINSAQKYNSSVSGGVWSNVHKNSQRYKNIDALSSYSDKFGINFNQKVKLSKYKRYKIVLVEMSGMNINYTTRPDISCGSDWQNVYACQDYNNNYGAGGGGRGAENPVFYPDAFSGKGGFVGISYRPICRHRR